MMPFLAERPDQLTTTLSAFTKFIGLVFQKTLDLPQAVVAKWQSGALLLALGWPLYQQLKTI